MKVLLLQLFLLVIVFIFLFSMLSKVGVHRIAQKVITTTKLLKKQTARKSDTSENYSRWLEQNPRGLWIRILSHETENKKLREELSHTMWTICESIEKIISLDQTIAASMQTSTIDSAAIERIKQEKEQLVVVVDQAFSDIVKVVG